MPQQVVPEIHWFTTHYVVPEDRLRLSCTLKSGDTDVFWLTQRLATALIRSLLDWLDKTVERERSPELAHQFAQQSANAKRPKRPAGTVPEGPGWLVNAVNVRPLEKALILTFKDAGDRAARISFDPQHLRRWLKVLHAQYRRSGWPMDLWPEWIDDAPGSAPSVQSGMLH